MTSFASALSQHPVPTEAVGEAVGEVLESLGGRTPDLAVLFASPHNTGAFEDIVGAVRTLLQPGVLLGTTAAAVIGGSREVEEGPALGLFSARFGDAPVRAVRLTTVATADGHAVAGWPDGADEGTLFAFADPFTFPTDAFLSGLSEARPEVRVLGGLASAARGPGGNRLALDDEVLTDGAVGALVPASVSVVPVVSQGCRPIGSPLVVTAANGNVIEQLGGRPAVQRLEETVAALDEAERGLASSGLHVGIVVDEQRDQFERGDFLVRNIVGLDRSSGALAVGDVVEVGRTVQFHVRDAASADEDLREMLSGHAADAALLFTCNGRGRHLFGVPDHDAALVDTLVGPTALAGMFCAGEIGPVGSRNFLHGFTASLALLRAG